MKQMNQRSVIDEICSPQIKDSLSRQSLFTKSLPLVAQAARSKPSAKTTSEEEELSSPQHEKKDA